MCNKMIDNNDDDRRMNERTDREEFFFSLSNGEPAFI